MDANKPDIALIRKYLNGELDARAMFELERRAEEDPFLWDMIRGMESSDINHEPNLTAINQMIDQRVARDDKRVLPMWRRWSVAASLLIALGIGGWWVLHEPAAPKTIVLNMPKVEQADKAKVERATADTQQPSPIAKKPLLAQLHRQKIDMPGKSHDYEKQVSPAMAIQANTTDSIEYKTKTYVARSKASINDLLAKLPGTIVDSAGNVTTQGNRLTRVRLNGKDFFGSDLKKATGNLPADVIAKTQVIDDYGDQASKKENNTEAKVAAANPILLKSVPLKAKTQAEAKTVTGRIVDKDNHQPLPGALITLDGIKKVSTITDINGNFRIEAAGENATLHIAYLGYENQQVKVRSKDSLKIAMAPASNTLSEVIIAKKEVPATEADIIEAQPLTGWDAYDKYLKDNAVIADGKTGVVKVSFTVEQDGTLSNIKVEKGLSGATNNKAIQLIFKGPKWTPRSNGEPQEIKLRIRFHK